MDQEKTSRLIMKALGAGIYGDPDEAVDILQEIGAAGDWNRMYGVCCAFASVGLKFIEKTTRPKAAGEMWGIEELVPGALGKDPADQFAARFLVAYANDDPDNALALYEAIVQASTTEYVEAISALFAQAVGLGRMADAHLHP